MNALAASLIALMACALLFRLASFPGLHGDEAWIGLFAQRLSEHGLSTPHEMNTYTGPFYGWILARVFESFGMSILSLRLPGALLNIGAWLLFWRTAARAGGARGGLAWALLAAASGIVVLKSRVAWEVYALQPLLLAAALYAVSRRLEGGGRGWPLLLFYASLLGVQNHFIFLSFPVALAVAAAVLYGKAREERRLDLLELATANLLPCGLLFAAKPQLSEAGWAGIKGPALLAFWLLPFAASALLDAAPRRRKALKALFEAAPPSARHLPKVFAALLVIAFWFHWVALIEIQSGAAVLWRLASWKLPGPAEAGLFAAGAALLAFVFHDALRRLEDPKGEPGAALLAVLPAVYAAVFVLFRNTSSIRYYVVFSHLILLAGAVGLTRLPRAWLGAAGAGALVLQGLFWTALSSPMEREPLRFRIGWHREKSHDFIPKGELFEKVARAGACVVAYDESMLDVLLHFDRTIRRYPCVEGLRVRPSYCWGCPDARFRTEFDRVP